MSQGQGEAAEDDQRSPYAERDVWALVENDHGDDRGQKGRAADHDRRTRGTDCSDSVDEDDLRDAGHDRAERDVGPELRPARPSQPSRGGSHERDDGCGDKRRAGRAGLGVGATPERPARDRDQESEQSARRQREGEGAHARVDRSRGTLAR